MAGSSSSGSNVIPRRARPGLAGLRGLIVCVDPPEAQTLDAVFFTVDTSLFLAAGSVQPTLRCA